MLVFVKCQLLLRDCFDKHDTISYNYISNLGRRMVDWFVRKRTDTRQRLIQLQAVTIGLVARNK